MDRSGSKSITIGSLQLTDLTDDQIFIMERTARMVGLVLDQVESTFAPGSQTISALQIDKLKKLVQIPLYDFRNDLLRRFTIKKVE